MRTGSRPGAALLLCGALLVVPLLVLHTGSGAGHQATNQQADLSSGHPDAAADPGQLTAYERSTHAGATRGVGSPAPTTTTTAPTPTPDAPVETTTPSQDVASHTAVAPTPTTATVPTPAPAPTTATTTPAASVGSGVAEEGQVTYYAHPAGTCASPWLPFGTVVRITNPANGESVSCVVNDREADTARAIDLATDTFAEIAPLSQGVIDAQLSW